MKIYYILLAYLSLLALSFIDNSRGPAYPSILENFQISSSKGSYIFVLASVAALFTNLSSRWWLFSFGVINSTRVALCALCLGSLGIAWAGFLGSYSTLLIFSFVAGIGFSISGITMTILVSRGSSVKHRRKFFSGLHAVYGFSSFVAPLLLNLVVLSGLNWKHSFLIVGIIPLIVLIYSFFYSTPEKQETSRPKIHVPIYFFKRVPYGLIFAFYVSSEVMLSSRLVLYLREGLRYSDGESNLYLSLFFLFLLVGRLLFALRSFSLSNIAFLKLSLALTLVSFSIGYTIHPLGLSFCGLTMSMFFPLGMDWLNTTFKKGMDFMTTSVMTYVGVTLALLHWVFGILVDVVGITNAYLLVPVLTASCLIVLLVNREKHKT